MMPNPLNSIFMKLTNPKPKTRFYNFNNRLALFHATADHEAYWKQYWTDEYFKKLIERADQGKLEEFEHYAFRYLKPDHVILEAGCGPAHMVQGLVSRGFTKVLGIDYEPKVVQGVNKHLPHLQVKEGNVFNLDLPDNALDAYLSFGVVEHFTEGPDKILAEAHRVIAPEGIAMISVPYLNPLRKKHRAAVEAMAAQQSSDGLFFHQYYFDKESFGKILNENGFQVLETFPYAVHAFLTREHTGFMKFWNSAWCRTRVRNWLKKYFYYAGSRVRNNYGHMVMFICRKQ
jgi:SAM-dependent methyltransferase